MPEPEAPKRRNVLLQLAAEGIVPVIGGCAGALAGGPVGGIAGVAVGHAVEKAINLFGRGIVERWKGWFARHPEAAPAAVAELAALPPAEARREARDIVLELAPDAAPPDIDLVVEFLSAIPRAVDRALVPDPAGGGRSLPPTVSFDDPRSLLQLLPEDIPPYPAAADLPGTPYRLVELLGSGGFGAVYRAVSPTLQHLPLAIKFCLDRSLLPALNQERSNLERLMRAGGPGSRHVVRLYGYDLDHATPYLVYEYVEGGDLTRLVAARRAALGRAPDPGEVLGWVLQLAEGLAFAHRAGLVHRDLKPANVLADGDTLKLADFGLGGVAAARAAVRSRIGTTTVDYLSLADQASLFRGAGTPLYMSPEQRRGAAPDPRHDLYALGVVWYQLLTGDVSRELHHGWAKELVVRFGVPAAHIALIERCVGWYDERPADAGELLPLLKEAARLPSPLAGEGGGRSEPGEGPSASRTAGVPPAAEERASRPRSTDQAPPTPVSELPWASPDTARTASQVTPIPVAPVSDSRRRGLTAALARLSSAYAELDDLKRWRFETTALYGFLLGLLVGWLVGEVVYAIDHPTGMFPAAFRGPVLDPISILVGVVAGLLVWAAYVYLIRSGVTGVAEDLRKRAEAVAAELVADFPAEVAEWGGRAVLRHPSTVRQIRDELDREAGLRWPRTPRHRGPGSADGAAPPHDGLPDSSRAAVAAPSSTSALSPDQITADITRRAVLVARMREYARLLKDTKDNTDATWVGLVFLWLFAVPTLGGAAGALPRSWDTNPPLLVMLGLGVPAGGITAILVWWGMAAVRRHLARKRDAAADRLAADYPQLVEAWGGRSVLLSQETIAALLRTYDAAAAANRPGFLRRMFGG